MRYTGPDGKKRFETSRSTAKKDAEALLILRKKEVMQGKDPLAEKRIKNYPFTELADQYRKWAARQRAYHTSKKYFITDLQAFFGRCYVERVAELL